MASGSAVQLPSCRLGTLGSSIGSSNSDGQAALHLMPLIGAAPITIPDRSLLKDPGRYIVCSYGGGFGERRPVSAFLCGGQNFSKLLLRMSELGV